jgi:thiamine biosynthesis lipoprotein
MSDSQIFSDSFFALKSTCDVVLSDVTQEFAEEIFQEVKAEMDQLESIINPLADSPISVLNEAKKGEWLSVSDELWDILTIAYDFYQMSNGAFDVTVTPLVELWKYSESPSEKEIEEAKSRSGFDKVEFDFEKQKIQFKEDGIEFNLGALAKGIALDTIKPILLEKGINNAIISFGERSVLALGKHPNGDDWPIGIRNTIRPHEFVHAFLSSNQSVTTSGALLNVDEGSAKKKNHIISPATGLLVEENKTVSVKSDSATMGDFISTTWLILPENDKLILSEKLKNIEILEVDYLEDDLKTKLTIL